MSRWCLHGGAWDCRRSNAGASSWLEGKVCICERSVGGIVGNSTWGSDVD